MARYLRDYVKSGDRRAIDGVAPRYYEVLRTADELSVVAAYSLAEAGRETHQIAQPAWRPIVDDMIEFFRTRSGVTINMPPAP